MFAVEPVRCRNPSRGVVSLRKGPKEADVENRSRAFGLKRMSGKGCSGVLWNGEPDCFRPRGHEHVHARHDRVPDVRLDANETFIEHADPDTAYAIRKCAQGVRLER